MKSNQGKVAFLVTGNIHKFKEAKEILASYKIATAMLNIDAVEIQNDDIKAIAVASATDAARKTALPVFVEDAGLFIDALNGFPGPYSSFVYETVGTKGILRLMKQIDKRNAYFRSVVAYRDLNKQSKCLCFEGRVDGKIAFEERGQEGFGFDPIFEPSEGMGKTFAEMSTDEKNQHSHRAEAMRKFANWYTSGPQRRF